MAKYSMGLDFGTLSGRAVIVDIETGEEKASSVMEYKHGVMDEHFVDGSSLPLGYALQHPLDYLETLYFVTNDCIKKSGVDAEDIIGVGVDFTSCTILPVDKCAKPLCLRKEYQFRPHAYVKLWKHHGAQKEADEINALGIKRGEDWVKRYGGSISSEFALPKILQVLRKDQEIYDETYRFVEAGDWIVWNLTGVECCSACAAGFKFMYDAEKGYPEKEFFRELDGRLENIIGGKISVNVNNLSKPVGYVTDEMEKLTGLKAGTPVMPALIDAHAGLPALGITEEGKLLIVLGTSGCHIALSKGDSSFDGVFGCVKDGVVDGLYAVEAGQAGVGDSFDWFVKNCVPQDYYLQAEKEGVNIHKFLREKAQKLSPGSGGVMALDWWNGNRTPYSNDDLSGVIVGLNLTTKPEQIYRAMIEATAFGTRRIVELYEEHGVKINAIYAAGGIAEKDAMLMQIYSDVLGKEIFLSGTKQACAYGSAVLGAVNKNGYKTLSEASKNMKKVKSFSYKPNLNNMSAYQKLYIEYKKLSDYFARENSIMEKNF